MTMSMVSITLSATLAWIVSLATLPRYVHRAGDGRVAAYWHTVTLVALALTVAVPPVYLGFDRFLHLPNAARWVEDALLLASAYTIEGFFFALAHSDPGSLVGDTGTPDVREQHAPQQPWLLLSLLVILAGMAASLWRADLHADSIDFTFSQLVPALVIYRVLFLGYFSFVVVHFIAHATHYRRITPDVSHRFSMGLTSVAGYCALAYVLLSLIAILTPGTLALAEPVHVVLMLCIALTVAFTMVGSTFPLWSRRVGALALINHVSTAMSCWRLKVLWHTLAVAAPEVVLPTWITWWAALAHPAEMELLLNRRVIEILDARRILLTETGSIAQRGKDTMRVQEHVEVSNEASEGHEPASALSVAPSYPAQACDGGPEKIRNMAIHEARWLHAASVTALEQRLNAMRGNDLDVSEATRSLPAGVPAAGVASRGTLLYQPPTFREQVRYLEWVAAELRRQRWSSRAIAWRMQTGRPWSR